MIVESFWTDYFFCCWSWDVNWLAWEIAAGVKRGMDNPGRVLALCYLRLGGNTRYCYVLEKGLHPGNSCVLFSTQANCTRETVLSIRLIRFKYSTYQRLSILCHSCDMPLWNSRPREVFLFGLPKDPRLSARVLSRSKSSIFGTYICPTTNPQSARLIFDSAISWSTFTHSTPNFAIRHAPLREFTHTVSSTLSCRLRGLRPYNAESTPSHGRHITISLPHHFHLLSSL